MICQSAPPGRIRPASLAPDTQPPRMSMTRRSPYGVCPSRRMSASSASMRKMGCGESIGMGRCHCGEGRVGQAKRRDRVLREERFYKPLAAAIGVGLFLVSAAAAQPLGLGTSPQSTLTYSIGAAVAKVLADAGHIQSRVQPQSGTGTMIPLVNSGEIDIGFCNTLELYDAFHGVGTFDKRPNPKLRTLAVIFPIKVGLFVRNDSP